MTACSGARPDHRSGLRSSTPATFGRYRSWRSYAPNPPVHSSRWLPLAVPAAADAATRNVVRGAGWGHGIGMSQYGAYGYALEGSGYRGILSHYYSGTSLVSSSQRSVRILLQPDDPYIRVRGATRGGRPAEARHHLHRAPLGGRITLSTPAASCVGRFSSGLELDRPGRRAAPARSGDQRRERRALPRRGRDPERRRRPRPPSTGSPWTTTCAAWWPARCRPPGRSRRSRPRPWRRARTPSPRARPAASSTSTPTPARRSTAA